MMRIFSVLECDEVDDICPEYVDELIFGQYLDNDLVEVYPNGIGKDGLILSKECVKPVFNNKNKKGGN